jgi:hypothetical protein
LRNETRVFSGINAEERNAKWLAAYLSLTFA